MIVRIQLKILQYVDRAIQLLQLFDELHSHTIDLAFLHHNYNQHHDIYHGKYQGLVTNKHQNILQASLFKLTQNFNY